MCIKSVDAFSHDSIRETINYLCRFIGVFVNSAVGTSCSPGRTQRIGPSLESRGSICTIDIFAHGIVYGNESKEKITFSFFSLYTNRNEVANLFQKWILFQSSEQIWEIATNFFVHFANQTDLMQWPVSKRSLRIVFFHLFVVLGHR